MIESSTFAVVRSHISTGHVQSAIQHVSLDDKLGQVYHDHPFDCVEPEPILVLQAGTPVGWIDRGSFELECQTSDEWEGTCLRDVKEEIITPIHAQNVVSASTPIVDAAALFAQRQAAKMEDIGGDMFDPDKFAFFFVLDNSRISGIVRWGDLFKAPGRLCFFALTLELEEAALALCANFSGNCWDALTDARRKLALDVHKKRYGGITEQYIKALRNRMLGDSPQDFLDIFHRDLIDSTTFIDKATMITKCNLLVGFSNQNIKRLFSRAERLRNVCAHPSNSEVGSSITSPAKLAEFIREAQLLISEIKMVTPR